MRNFARIHREWAEDAGASALEQKSEDLHRRVTQSYPGDYSWEVCIETGDFVLREVKSAEAVA